MEQNSIPPASIAPVVPKEAEEDLYFAYQELLVKHKELINFTKAIGVYDLYEPRQQYTTTH